MSCIICRSSDLAFLAELASVPVIGTQLLDSSDEARRVARGDIWLVGCRCCGHVFNSAFDIDRVVYDERYENSLMGSPHYRRYSENIINRLVSTYDLGAGLPSRSAAVAVNSCKCCAIAACAGESASIPGARPARIVLDHSAVTIIGDMFTPSRAPDADIVCSRYVLEHLFEPGGPAAVDPRSLCFKSRPRGVHRGAERRLLLDGLRGLGPTLRTFLLFHVVLSGQCHAVGKDLPRGPINAEFGHQFLTAEATFAKRATDERVTVPPDTQSFDGFRRSIPESALALAGMAGSGLAGGPAPGALGAGAKSITFLNILDRSGGVIERVVDINPLKARAFTAGTGHPIVPPAALEAAAARHDSGDEPGI